MASKSKLFLLKSIYTLIKIVLGLCVTVLLLTGPTFCGQAVARGLR